MNHSRYQNCCFHGLNLPTDTEVQQNPNVSQSQMYFNDITSVYFKLALNNTNISIDSQTLTDSTFETEKIILYLPNSIVSNPNEVSGNVWKTKNNTVWKMILPIETYGGN